MVFEIDAHGHVQGRFSTRPSCRILTINASSNRTGHNGSSGRLCYSFTSSITASVTAEINDGGTSTP